MLRLPIVAALGLLLGSLTLSAQDAAQPAPPEVLLRVQSDYLKITADAAIPPQATGVEYQLTMQGAEAAPGPWTEAPPPEADHHSRFTLTLPKGRWSRLEVRALAGGKVIAADDVRVRERTLILLSPERLAALPEPRRTVWLDYVNASRALAAREREGIAMECQAAGLPHSLPAPARSGDFEISSRLEPGWYAGPGAATLTDAILSYQTPAGAWSKGVDYAAGPRAPGTHWTPHPGDGWHYCGTLDNRATTQQILLLARVFNATARPDAAEGVRRGLEWLLAAQFPGGGWPQVYPLEPGYHEAITFNDGASLHALALLLDVSQGKAPFTYVDSALRERAATVVARGIAGLLDCQVKLNGQPTVWCAQHDPLTLEPVGARLKEPPSLSGAESAEILTFLMREAPVSPATTSAVEAGLAWFAAHRITGLRKTQTKTARADYINDPASPEVYWARFYDLKTGQPVFAGAQDGILYSSFGEMAARNKVAYDYFTDKPATLLGKETSRWRKRLAGNR